MKLVLSMSFAAVAAVAVSCTEIKMNQAPAIRGRATFTVKKLDPMKPQDPVLYDLSFKLPSDEQIFKKSCAVYLRYDTGVFHTDKVDEVEEAAFPIATDRFPKWTKIELTGDTWTWDLKGVNMKNQEVLWVHLRVDFPNGESTYAYRIYPLVQPMEFADFVGSK